MLLSDTYASGRVHGLSPSSRVGDGALGCHRAGHRPPLKLVWPKYSSALETKDAMNVVLHEYQGSDAANRTRKREKPARNIATLILATH
jgi:hypothetical protein